MEERLQKILSRHGICSRRGAEQAILEGRVWLNGIQVTELGTKADPERDRITVDDQPLQPYESTYLLLHKPSGFLCTRHDPQERKTIQDLLPTYYQSLFSVGRLDFYSSGALLLTNDGELANHLTHPRYHIPKTYQVWLEGYPTDQQLQQWADGIMLDQKVTQPAEINILQTTATATLIQIELHEGRNRQIRRCAELLGYRVKGIHRIQIGEIDLGELESGEFRLLRSPEVNLLRNFELNKLI
jgi:16S rRNA pseudouridine516 synthase